MLRRSALELVLGYALVQLKEGVRTVCEEDKKRPGVKVHQVEDVLGVLEMSLQAALDVGGGRLVLEHLCRELDVILHVLFQLNKLALDIGQ